ncbi:GNAT family N-acetyltransferase [Pseudonocardia asaccharolytica]|uniref:GNAT family N-acetyltransferase n=1 Tax=Pseudonocardia asaccharolytica TaxID=54010 RepID=UPI001B7F9575|nr:GNAT family N-acetyltransferase [Pseudonocardia asaccharolytica]
MEAETAVPAAAGAEVRVAPLGAEYAGEAWTVQRAAYVAEAQRYCAQIPPLVETLATVRAELARADGPELVARGAWLGPRLVGSVRGRIDGDRMEVSRFAVAPDVQHRGIGRALLAAVHAAAPPPVRTFWLVAAAGSEDNLRFYAAAGYRVVDHLVDHLGVTLARMERPAR